MKLLSSNRRALLSMFTRTLLLVSLMIFDRCVADESTEETSPEFFQYLAEDRGNFVYIADTAPVVRRFLESRGGQRIVETFASGDRGASPKALLREFENGAEQFVPDQICLAMSNKSMAGVCGFINLGMHLGLCAGAVQAGESDVLDELQQGLLDSLEKVELEEMDIWIRFRNEFVPTMIESQIRSAVSELSQGSRVDIELDLNGMSATMKPRDFVPPTVVSGGLFALGITDDLSDPELKKAGEIIADKELSIRLTRYGSALLIQFGSKTKGKPKATLKVSEGKLWADDETMLMYSRYDLRELAASLKQANSLWEKYAETSIGAACRELDTEDLLGDLRDLVEVFDQDVAGELRVSLNEQLIIDGYESGHKQIPSLAESGISRFVPATSSAWMISTEYSLSDLIRQSFSGFEDRLSRQSLKDQMNGDVSKSPTDAVAEFYYTELKEFRRLLREDLPSVFVTPMAMVAESDLESTTLTVNFDFEGDPNSVTLVDLPVPKMAIIARLGPGRSPSDFAKAAQKAFLQAWDIEEDLQMATEFKIEDVSSPAVTLATDWQKDVLPHGIRIIAEGSPTLHTVILPDQWMIFSTSTELTRSILNASSDASLQKMFSETELAGTNLLQSDANAVNNSFLLPLRILRMIGDDEIEMSSEGQFGGGFVTGFKGGLTRNNLGTVLLGIESAVKEMKELRMETQHNAGVRTLKASVSFAE